MSLTIPAAVRELPLNIRPAGEADLPALTQLLAEMDGEPPMPIGQAARAFREMRRNPECNTYLVESGGRPVATFTLLIFTTLVHGGARQAVLDGVVVAPHLRGQGLGRRMVREAMRICARGGCYKLALSSNAKREDAHRFYRSLGFEQHGWSFAVHLASERALQEMNAGMVPVPD